MNERNICCIPKTKPRIEHETEPATKTNYAEINRASTRTEATTTTQILNVLGKRANLQILPMNLKSPRLGSGQLAILEDDPGTGKPDGAGVLVLLGRGLGLVALGGGLGPLLAPPASGLLTAGQSLEGRSLLLHGRVRKI